MTFAMAFDLEGQIHRQGIGYQISSRNCVITVVVSAAQKGYLSLETILIDVLTLKSVRYSVLRPLTLNLTLKVEYQVKFHECVSCTVR